MDEAVRTRALELVRRDLELAERMRSLDPSPGEVMRIEELRAMIEALSTGCRAGQHEFVVREGVPQLYCRRCGIGKVPEVQRPGVVDGDDAAQTIYRQAQKIEDLRHKVQSQERAISEQRATIEALHEAEGRLVRQRDELRQQVDSQVIIRGIGKAERERYVKQIGQLVGERDRLKEQVGTLEARVREQADVIFSARSKAEFFEQQWSLADDAAKSLKAEVASLRADGAVAMALVEHGLNPPLASHVPRDPDGALKRRIEDLEQNLGRMQVARDMASEQLASLRRSIRGFARQHAP